MNDYKNFSKTKQAIEGLSDLIGEFSKIAEDKKKEILTRETLANEENTKLEKKIESLKNSADNMVSTIDDVINKIEMVKKENGTSSNNN